jgi:predicted Zn-dependent protease
MLSQGEIKKSLGFYEKAFARQQTLPVIMKYSKALALAGNKRKAVEPLKIWVEKNPNDYKTKVVLATTYQNADMLDEAIRQLEDVQRKSPDNPIVLNNLSWMYFEKGDPRALEMAEKAYKQQPEVPAIADTYGWLLIQNGDSEKGVPLIKKASEKLDGRNLEINYHLAVGYSKTGNTAAAKELLISLVGVKSDFQQNAKKLLKELQ